MKSAVKNIRVLHSTLAKTFSISALAKISKSMTPSRADQPKDKFNCGTECRKNKVMTNAKVNADFISRGKFLIGYCKIKTKQVVL